MTNNDFYMVDVTVDTVVKFVDRNQNIVCLVGSHEVTLPVGEVEFLKLPVVVDAPCAMKIPRWILLDRGLEHLIK